MSGVQLVRTDDESFNVALADFVDRELLPEISDLFSDAAEDVITFDIIRASQTYGISYYN